MRAITEKSTIANSTVTSETALNRIGAFNETGITCSNFTLKLGDYISALNVTYTVNNITKIALKSNNGTTISKGKTVTGVQT